MPTPNKIVLKGDPIYKERQLKALDVYGDGAITPGMLVEPTANHECAPHATAGGNASPIFGVEAPYRPGEGSTLAIDTNYDEDGENVLLAYCRPGDEIYALIEVGANISENDLLQSNGAGYLEAYSSSTPPPLRPVCRALESVNNSAGSTPARIKVEVV